MGQGWPNWKTQQIKAKKRGRKTERSVGGGVEGGRRARYINRLSKLTWQREGEGWRGRRKKGGTAVRKEDRNGLNPLLTERKWSTLLLQATRLSRDETVVRPSMTTSRAKMLIRFRSQYPVKDEVTVARSGYFSETWGQSPVRVTVVLQQNVS